MDVDLENVSTETAVTTAQGPSLINNSTGFKGFQMFTETNTDSVSGQGIDLELDNEVPQSGLKVFVEYSNEQQDLDKLKPASSESVDTFGDDILTIPIDSLRPRSYSVQVGRNRKMNSADAQRRSSASQPVKPPKKEGDNEAEIVAQRPRSSGYRSNSTPISYTDSEGVQLRGDKGKARKKSSNSSSKKSMDLQVSNEWSRSFRVSYKPRPQATRMLNKLVEPPNYNRLPLLNQPDDMEEKSSRKNYNLRPKQSLHPHYHQALRPRHVEVHYEDFLPKNLWLELKPKRFTKNHKHGNHFEIRHYDQPLPSTSSAKASNDKKEAFVWENPYQIWLMEKTPVD